VSVTANQDDEETASLPHKGKPSEFFIPAVKEDGAALNPDLNPYNYEMKIE